MLGDDVIEFSAGEGIYAEQFNLIRSASNPADPVKLEEDRRLRACGDGCSGGDPRRSAKAKAPAPRWLHARGSRTCVETPCFNADYPGNMLDILVEEEKRLAVQEKREPRSREVLGADRHQYL